MTLLEKILNCSDDEVDRVISEELANASENSIKIQQLGFIGNGKANCVFKGFIPLNTRIKYESMALETYGMETTDFFYEFAHFIKKHNISSTGSLLFNIEYFINKYFGYSSENSRSVIFNDIAFQSTTTDEEYFQALQNNKIGDLKGKGAAQCTEKAAIAQQLLSLFGFESYYCMGCVDLNNRQEAHSFNIVKKGNGYAIVDYSLPVTLFNQDGSVKAFYPFVGEMTNEEFNEFVNSGVLKLFDSYEYHNNNQKVLINDQRKYVLGQFEIQNEKSARR